MVKIKECYYNIKRCIKWFPVIWKTREWDYSYILKLMQMQIKLMRQRTETIQFYIGWEQSVKYMKICEKLLDIIISGECKYRYFGDAYFKYMDKCKKLLFNILYKKIEGWWD